MYKIFKDKDNVFPYWIAKVTLMGGSIVNVQVGNRYYRLGNAKRALLKLNNLKEHKMYKASNKDIKWLMSHSDKDLVLEQFKDIQPEGYDIAYYAPSNANWCYNIKIVELNGFIYEVITQFGAVKSGRVLHFRGLK